MKLNIMLQCASAVDNLAAFYFNNITMGEAPTSPAAINLARHIVDAPNLFPEVSMVYCILHCRCVVLIVFFMLKK